MRSIKLTLLFILTLFASLLFAQQGMDNRVKEFRKKLTSELKSNHKLYNFPPASRVDSVFIDSDKNLTIVFNRRTSGNVLREIDISKATERLTEFKNKNGFKDSGLKIFIGAFELKEMVPNYYRVNMDQDPLRLPAERNKFSLVSNDDKPFEIKNGLTGRNLVVWNSHGWYYSHEDDRWQWQRARLWGSVEDLLTTSMVVPYLVPMLENAGAGVFLPRERDFQISEVIIDNESSNGKSRVEGLENWKNDGKGFLHKADGYDANVNPFRLGSFIKTSSSREGDSKLSYMADIPEEGEYAVYVAYGRDSESKNIPDAIYTVYHAGGKTSFRVNQTAGWGTWIYLGTFKFPKGFNREKAAVVLSNKSNFDGNVTSDAVRFGGGMGVVKRNGKTSGKPKFAEGARYYLQFLGVEDTLVYNMGKDVDDYVDDYRARAEYANWLNGAPAGPNKQKDFEGLKIPVDLTMAWHTDAGILGADSVVGTLMIHSSFGMDTTIFPGGRSRMANRDLADIVQSQIVDDIKFHFDKKWSRRELMDANYAEAVRGNIPGILLELLSHQNFAEMKFFWDPKFRFTASRAIYKGMVKFIAHSNKEKYAIQPLPVNGFSALLNGQNVSLSWEPVNDPLEPTASPEGYIVYKREGNGGFDNGTLTRTNSFVDLNIPEGKVISYKITAINSGGESFPSEILSVGIGKDKNKKLLIINAFDRLAAPAQIVEKDFEGFLFNFDEGVQYQKDVAFTGEQINFDRKSEFKSNDAPGFGASKSDKECLVIAGNSFDYPSIHGEAMLEAGFSFSSTSDEAVEDGKIPLNGFDLVDLIAGEEKYTKSKLGLDPVIAENYQLFTPQLKKQLGEFLNSGKSLFISGAYVGSELETETTEFGSKVLKVKLGTEFASTNGEVSSVTKYESSLDMKFKFNTDHSANIYRVEAPQAINPEKEGETLLRYSENTNSAAAGFRGGYKTVVAGFPFETITDTQQRNKFMKFVLNYLGM